MASSTKPSPPEYRVFNDLALIGGHPALDFVNTVKYRGELDPQDNLESLSDIIKWAQVAQLVSRTEASRLSRQTQKSRDTAQIYREICQYREHVRLIFERTRITGRKYVLAATKIEATIAALRPTAKISRSTGELSQRIEIRTAEDLKARIVASVVEILRQRSSLQIKVCGGLDCDWLFVDRTKAGRRLWCDTRTCGNLARVRRFRLNH